MGAVGGTARESRDRHAPPDRRGGGRPARAAGSSPPPSCTAPTSTRPPSAIRSCTATSASSRSPWRRRPDRAQGRDLDRGNRDDGRLEDPRGLRAAFDSTVAARCKAEGLPIIGKTNTDEFAMGSSTENSAYGPTRNPWDPERVPGGSGGGTAAAVSAGLAPWGLGSDTGGSIKQPSALCGNVGLRPTYGTVAGTGSSPSPPSLDQVGPVARNVRDCALLYSDHRRPGRTRFDDRRAARARPAPRGRRSRRAADRDPA